MKEEVFFTRKKIKEKAEALLATKLDKLDPQV